MKEAEAIPKWMLRKYAQIWQVFKGEEFSADDLVEKLTEDKKIVFVLMSRLREKGWLITEAKEKDKRKKKYRLKPIEEMLEMIAR